MSKRIAVMGMLIVGVTWLCAGSAAAAAERCEGAPGLPDPAVVAGGVIDTAQIGLGRTAADPAAFGLPAAVGVPAALGTPAAPGGPVALGAPIEFEGPVRTAVGGRVRPVAAALDLAAGRATGVCADADRVRGLKTEAAGGLPRLPVVADKPGHLAPPKLPISGVVRKATGVSPSVTVPQRVPAPIGKLPLE